MNGNPTSSYGLHESGASVYVEMSFAVVRDADGRVVGSVAIARDVTGKQRAARAASAG